MARRFSLWARSQEIMETTVAPNPTPTPAPAAPAPSSTPAPSQPAVETQSAVEHARDSGNFKDYRQAKNAERSGKPLPPKPVAAKAPTPAPAAATGGTVGDAGSAAPADSAPKLTRREREQNETNERIRLAVERATAQVRAEYESRQPATVPTSGQPAAAPEWQRIANLPDAPKLADFETVEAHTAAMSYFVAATFQREQAQQAEQRSAFEAQEVAERVRTETFVGVMEKAKAADPQFAAKLSPDVRALKPVSGVDQEAGERVTPRNIVAEQFWDSPISDKILVHLSQNDSAELRRLETVPPQYQHLPGPARARAHIQWIIREMGAIHERLSGSARPAAPQQPTTLTAAPTVETLGERSHEATDPVKAAAASGDFGAFRRAKRAALLAGSHP